MWGKPRGKKQQSEWVSGGMIPRPLTDEWGVFPFLQAAFSLIYSLAKCVLPTSIPDPRSQALVSLETWGHIRVLTDLHLLWIGTTVSVFTSCVSEKET